jgi:hypothetical protein
MANGDILPTLLGAAFGVFFTPFNPALRWFFMYICFLNPLSSTRVHGIPAVFSALAVETLLPASGNRFNYSHDFFVDTRRSSRYIVHSTCSTACNNFVLAGASATSIWRPSGGDRCSGRWHEAAIEQQTRRKWSFAIRDREP